MSYTYQDAAHKHAVTHLNGVQKYWYDANGNRVPSGCTRKVGSDTYTLTWDYENRLTGVNKNGNTVATFTYDGDGKRVKKVEGGQTTVYVGAHYEKNITTGVATSYYYAGDVRVAMRQGGVVYWLLTDHLGSTAITANSSGVKVGERYYKWGIAADKASATSGQAEGPHGPSAHPLLRFYPLLRYTGCQSARNAMGRDAAWLGRWGFQNSARVGKR